MIRTLIELLPPRGRSTLAAHLALTVLSVVLRACTVLVLVPLLTALFGPTPSAVWPWVAVFVGVTCAGWGVDWIVAKLGFELGFQLLERAQETVADAVAHTRLTWFTPDHLAATRQAISSTGPDLVGLMTYLITPLISAVLVPIAITIGLIPISWQLAVASLAGVPLLLGSYWLSRHLTLVEERNASAANSAVTERIVEFARTQHALRAARRVDPERSQVGDALTRHRSATRRLLLLQVPGQLVFGLASQIALVALVGTTVVLVLTGQVPIPAAVALSIVVVRYLEPFAALAELSGGVESATTALSRMRDVLTAPKLSFGTTELAGSDSVSVEFDNVSFGYDSASQPVLDGLTLRFESGTTTAIVGPSGSGKSTILALLAGLQDPTSGRILVDGRDANTLSEDSRQRLVSVVFQQPYLFDGTLRDNVSAGGTSSSALDDVAHRAQVDTIVDRLPDGWNTRVGEGGASLSGGERQRVSIARALAKPSSLLLVDEATSALDTENEAAIAAALTADDEARTRVVVAHRLTSIQAADRVIFVEGGRVVEDGGVAELLAAGGRFAAFWHQQNAASGWKLGEDAPA